MTIPRKRTGDNLLIFLALANAALLNAAPPYRVSGVVVDSRSHKPLSNGRVSLALSAARAQKSEQATKQDGRFTFEVAEPGKYTLQVAKPGYPRQLYKQSMYASVSSAIVVRDDQDTSNIVFEAKHAGAIAGQIKDEDSEPVGNALVAIFESAIVDGERRVITRGQRRANAAGEFRFPNLPWGNYYVCAMGRPWFADSVIALQRLQRAQNQMRPKPVAATDAQPISADDEPSEPDEPPPPFSPDPAFRGTAFVTTFYPQAQSVEEASLVRVDVGGEAQISITLQLAKAVSIKAAINGPADMSNGRARLFKKVYDQRVSFLEEWVRKDGAVEFKNVPAGSYEISATSQSASGPSSWNIQQHVEVGASDMEVTLRPAQLGALSGRVLFDAEPPAPGATLLITLRNDTSIVARDQIKPDGSFSLIRIPPGRYTLTAGNANYIAAYMTDSAGTRLPLTFDIGSGETVRGDLTLTRAVSTIEGTVESAGEPRVGAFVLLMPKDASMHSYRSDQTDSDGSFRLATIPAGDYLLLALNDGDNVAYRDPKVAAALAKAAKPLRVEGGDHLPIKLEPVNVATLNLPSS